MKNSKKMILPVVLLVLLMVLSACGNSERRTTNPSENTTPAATTNVESSETQNAPSELSEIRIVPESYNSPAAHQGTVETFTYSTESGEKTAYAYLPYGYDASGDTKYNILYFMHGGGGNAGQFYNRSYALNDILDHAIENGEINPLIVVTPSFYPQGDHDSSVSNAARLVSVFHTEFINDLMPAAESRYRTYAESTDAAGLEASRDHRAFGGFSMGSVTTWYQFVNALDYVRYFMPLSGDCWEYGSQGGASHPQETAAYLNDFISQHKYKDAFYIYAMTGGSDIAYDAMTNQLNAMKTTEGFRFGTSETDGNISFQILDGATHDYTWYRNYIYTILPSFFDSEQVESSGTASRTVQVTIGDTTGQVVLNDNKTADAFLEMLPLSIRMNDLHGREYWFSHSMPYDESDVVHDYAPGQLTYWCGGWVTACYDRDDDSVIEDGSVVIGLMDETLVGAFKALQGESVEVTFELAE